jgi:hypothetical protein
MSNYPNDPGYVSESATSAAAAEAAKKFSGSMADKCERWFKAWTEYGELKTCEECELAAREGGDLGRHQSISARIRTDLFLKRRCLYKTATHLVTREPVKIWHDSSIFDLVTDQKGKVVYQTRPTTSGREAVVYGWGYRT